MFKFLFLACIFAVVVPGFSVVNKCYTCKWFEHNSTNVERWNDEKCDTAEDMPTTWLVDCNDGYEGDSTTWQCVKVSGRVEVDDENFSYVERSCRPGNLTEAECKGTKSYQIGPDQHIKRGDVCVCVNEDGCNGGTSLMVGSVTFGVGLVATILSRL